MSRLEKQLELIFLSTRHKVKYLVKHKNKFIAICSYCGCQIELALINDELGHEQYALKLDQKYYGYKHFDDVAKSFKKEFEFCKRLDILK